MKTGIAVLLTLTLMSAAEAAQTSNGYVFFAPGGATCYGHTEMSLHFGAGMDAARLEGLRQGDIPFPGWERAEVGTSSVRRILPHIPKRPRQPGIRRGPEQVKPPQEDNSHTNKLHADCAQIMAA
jgi:hypothetical protein